MSARETKCLGWMDTDGEQATYCELGPHAEGLHVSGLGTPEPVIWGPARALGLAVATAVGAEVGAALLRHGPSVVADATVRTAQELAQRVDDEAASRTIAAADLGAVLTELALDGVTGGWVDELSRVHHRLATTPVPVAIAAPCDDRARAVNDLGARARAAADLKVLADNIAGGRIYAMPTILGAVRAAITTLEENPSA